jgi:hypothetical protein
MLLSCYKHVIGVTGPLNPQPLAKAHASSTTTTWVDSATRCLIIIFSLSFSFSNNKYNNNFYNYALY